MKVKNSLADVKSDDLIALLGHHDDGSDGVWQGLAIQTDVIFEFVPLRRGKLSVGHMTHYSTFYSRM